MKWGKIHNVTFVSLSYDGVKTILAGPKWRSTGKTQVHYFDDTCFRNEKQTVVKRGSVMIGASTILSAFHVFTPLSQSNNPVKLYYYYSHFIEGMLRLIKVQQLTLGPATNKR